MMRGSPPVFVRRTITAASLAAASATAATVGLSSSEKRLSAKIRSARSGANDSAGRAKAAAINAVLASDQSREQALIGSTLRPGYVHNCAYTCAAIALLARG